MNDAAPEMAPLSLGNGAFHAAAPQTPSAPAVRRRLAMRLAGFMVIVILLAEAMFVVPSIVRIRQEWLDRRLTEAQLAALSVAVAPDGMVDRTTRDELLRLAGAEAIYLEQPGHRITVLSPTPGLPDAAPLDVAQETVFGAIVNSASSLFSDSDRLIAIKRVSPLREGATVTAILHEDGVHEVLARYVRRVGTISLFVAAAAGLLLHGALLVLLVRPIRRLTKSIAAFRADPERSTEVDEDAPDHRREDEIAAAARELAVMQRELRAALWRNARLAALGTAVAKVNHDLRGILSPAMLTAERLQAHPDPAVKRAGDVLVRAVDRAADLTRRTLEFTRETPMSLSRRRMALRPLVEEASEQARAACPLLVVANFVPPIIEIEADRESVVRVLGNLLRNAGEAEARRISVSAAHESGDLAIIVADDGPGLPDLVRASLFRPFVPGGRRGSTGLGLAIVHDLMRAHGGDVVLLGTGPTGTQFRLTLPERFLVMPSAAPHAAGTGH